MNDEIKLKDMIDCLENIYKDIKTQPTLEEELEKERKFINKIKDDNKDEVKELLDYLKNDYYAHGEIYIEDYCKVITKEKNKELLDYITNLQERKITKGDVDKYFEENMCVSFDKFIENWDEQKNWTNYYRKENEKLKKENTKLYKKDTKIINELKEELKITQEKWNKDKQWSECRTKEWLDYKSRCEKAIEYLLNNKLYTFKYDDEELFEITTDKKAKDDLLKILGGEE